MFEADTRVSVAGEKICINGKPTYPGNPRIEGLLFNVRVVNATFDDTAGKVDWWDDDGSHPENDCAGCGKWVSPDSAFANTQRFIAALPEYCAHGILAVNLNFQGGHPLMGKTDVPEGRGSAGSRSNGHRDFYHNSGFRVDGSLDPDYLRRIGDIIEACDRLGMVVILQFFYFGQDTVFTNEKGILAAVDSGVDFVCGRGYGNVLIEIANEIMNGHYHHAALKPGRVHELILRARRRAREKHGRELLVSTSEACMQARDQWSEEEISRVFRSADFILCHGGDDMETGRVGDSGIVVEKIEFLRLQKWFRESPKPIVFNESDGEQALDAAVRRGVSFGLHTTNQQTMWPPKWGVWDPEYSWFFRDCSRLQSQ